MNYRSNKADKKRRPATFEEFLQFYVDHEKDDVHWKLFEAGIGKEIVSKKLILLITGSRMPLNPADSTIPTF